jgi:hypothetical protein
MQALQTLPTDALSLVLDKLLNRWQRSEVPKKLMKLPEPFLDLWLHGQEVLNMMHSEIPIASLQKLIKRLPQNPDISVLHLPAKALEYAGVPETLALLTAVDDVLDKLPKLTHLGIHGLNLRQEHLPVFTSMCRGLRCKLTGLSLSLKSWVFGEFYGEKYLLEAIGKISKLEMLAFPRFAEFVSDSKDLLQPSKGRKRLSYPLKSRKVLLQLLATAQERTVFVEGEPSQALMAAVSEVAPNLKIVSVPFNA